MINVRILVYVHSRFVVCTLFSGFFV